MDLDVEYRDHGKRLVGFRVVVLPSKEKSRTRLCTNLPRTRSRSTSSRASTASAGKSSCCSKEWESYANLHKLDTANEHIAAGLSWASLCAAVLKRFLAHAAQLVGGKPISTRRVAMCSGHIIEELAAACASSEVAAT